MNIVYFLAPVSVCLGLLFVWMFIWATRKGQYDDLDTPAHKILFDEETQERIKK